ncbi:hypothetical protein Q4489_14115 [Thalassotalea sp. 1_MG-2023]|uniref:5' nucleotidase, NT5C type n=1 Tax=Thalassotalea sp. 1_MG-2023 TaxID=3062680 RepID=UPI0026E18BD2|nr:hypothetical protein [Thalassotalea sp. 1_MG-2023]MDO6428151.1 hypothetical protein [Thalassotalea sp. 1_MG-2023]
MDDVICDYSSAYQKALKNNPEIRYPQSQFDFFRKLAPVKDAIETLQTLDASLKFDIYILTAPSIKNPLCYLEKRVWIEEHLGSRYTENLIISPNKGLFIGDILIDDHICGAGQENFNGKLMHFGCEQYPNWSVLNEELNLI